MRIPHRPKRGCRQDQEQGEDRNACAAWQRDHEVGQPERLSRILLLGRPEQNDKSAQQHAERDRGQHGGKDHLAGHAPHQEEVHASADRKAERERNR
jgi:hypothetical protein